MQFCDLSSKFEYWSTVMKCLIPVDPWCFVVLLDHPKYITLWKKSFLSSQPLYKYACHEWDFYSGYSSYIRLRNTGLKYEMLVGPMCDAGGFNVRCGWVQCEMQVGPIQADNHQSTTFDHKSTIPLYWLMFIFAYSSSVLLFFRSRRRWL